MDYRYLFLWLIGYALVGRVCLSFFGGLSRRLFFLLINILGIYFLFLFHTESVFPKLIVVYLWMVSVEYLVTRHLSKRGSLGFVVALFFPITCLIAFKYLPFSLEPIWYKIGYRPIRPLGEYLVGLSYLAFRLSYTVVEYRSGRVKTLSFIDYLSYSLFPPILSVGPISPYSLFERSLLAKSETISWDAISRFLIGGLKCLLFGSLFSRLTFEAMFSDGNPHGLLDLFVCSISFYLYLYFNFSGFCDMAVAASQFLGIKIVENFSSPLRARNITVFWQCWHTSLSSFFREVVFTPVSKQIGHWFGHASVHLANIFSIALVFVLIGIWHGRGLNFVLYGCWHALGMIVHYSYVVFLRSHLSSESLKRYNDSRVVKLGATVLTFIFVSLSFIFFANRIESLTTIAGWAF